MVARTLSVAGIGLAAVAAAIGAKAATQVVPNFTLFSSAEDNVRLLPDTVFTETASSIVLDAGLDAAVYNERGFVTIEPRVLVNAYSDSENAELDGNDLFLDTRGEYSWERMRIGFRSEYRREAIIRSELPDVEDPDFDDDIGVDDPDSVDSGRLNFIDQERKRLIVRPFIEFAISERSRFRVQTDVTDVSFSGGDSIVRTGYDSRALRASVIRRPNERNTVTASLLVRNYEAGATNNNTDSVGIIGAISREVSDLWTVHLEAGVERSEYSFEDLQGAVDNASVEYLYGVRARRRGERTRLDVRLDHRQDGSATGFVVDRNQLRIYVDHAFTQRLSTRIALRADKYETLGNAGTQNDRDYLRAEFSLNWAMRPKWSIVGGYNYTSQDFVNEFSDARASDTLFIGIGYQGLSRPGAP